MNQHGIPSLIVWTQGRISSSFWHFVMQSRWAGASVLKAETKNKQRSERNTFISPPLLSQPKLISRGFSGQKNPSTWKLCIICVKTQRLRWNRRFLHQPPQYVYTTEHKPKNSPLLKKNLSQTSVVSSHKDPWAIIFEVYLGTASRITFTHFLSRKFSSPCISQCVSLFHQTKAPLQNSPHYFQVQDEHVCKKLIIL